MAKTEKYSLASPPFLVPVLSLAAVVMMLRPLLGMIKERERKRPATWVQGLLVFAGGFVALGRFLEASYAEPTDEGLHLRLLPPLVDTVIPYGDIESVTRVPAPGPFSLRMGGARTLGVGFSPGDVAQINLRGVEDIRVLGLVPLKVQRVELALADPEAFVTAMQQRRG